MTEQLALTLLAASVSFVAAVFFCIGNALNKSEKILLQSTPLYDFCLSAAVAAAAGFSVRATADKRYLLGATGP